MICRSTGAMSIRRAALLTLTTVAGACAQGSELPGMTPADGAAMGSAHPSADGGVSSAPGATGALPCEVEKVLVARCQSCHQRPPLYGAPMPLVTFADAMAPAAGGGTEVWRMMKAKVAAGLMPPSGSPGGPLTAAEKATLMTWLDAG